MTGLAWPQSRYQQIQRHSATPSAEENGKPLHVGPLRAARGSLDAVVKIIEFSDFQCPFSAKAQPILNELLRDYPNKIQLVFKNFPLPMHGDAPLAHEAALAAAQQGKFWEMHDLIFAHQNRLKIADLTEYAKQLSLNPDTFQEDLTKHRYQSDVEHDWAEARSLGINSTPTFLVNGEKIVGANKLRAAVEATLDPTQHVRSSSSAQQPYEIDIKDSPSRGPANAPVTIVEFSDLQCPFCARAVPVVQRILETYPTQVRLVFKSYPLTFHQNSLLAHQAALAAGNQGKFWEMHDLIFANQNALNRENLLHMAQVLRLDEKQFATDLDSGRFKSAIDTDKDQGERLGVSGTPTFYVNGTEIIGAASESDFKHAIEIALRTAPKTESAQRVNKSESEKYALGPSTAPVTIIWFTDVQSPLAPKAAHVIRQIINTYPDKVRVVLKHHPLDTHPDALLAHAALVAAGAQGKFWELHDLLLTHQSTLKRDDLVLLASSLGLNEQDFSNQLQNPAYRSLVESDLAEAQEREVRGTPVFFVNGKRLDGVQTFQSLSSLVQSELKNPSR